MPDQNASALLRGARAVTVSQIKIRARSLMAASSSFSEVAGIIEGATFILSSLLRAAA